MKFYKNIHKCPFSNKLQINFLNINIVYNENQKRNSSRERSFDHAALRYFDIQLTPVILVNALSLKGRADKS